MRSEHLFTRARDIPVCALLGAAALAAAAACSSSPEGAAAQAPNAQPPASQGPGQPGITWSEERLKAAAAPVRAGRVLTPRPWPNGARVAVCLSFDVDNESFTLLRGDTAPVTLSAGEYGAMKGLPRVLEALDRHGIAGSFYIPAVSAQLHPNMVEEIKKRGRHEIGVHGWIHENLVELNDAAEEERLLTQAIDYITKVSGKRPVGYRAPSWAFSQHTLGLIRKAGFLYDSSLMAMDEPYEIISNGQPTGLIELPVEWILDDAPYFGRAGSFPSPAAIFDVYRDEFDRAYQEGTMMMLTMHPHVIGHRSRIVHLEKLIAYMKSKPGVWFATAEEIARAARGTSSTN
jgi:peptidoglycan/xylan/chitin deacetylase (PgdA/CDA1 family)